MASAAASEAAGEPLSQFWPQFQASSSAVHLGVDVCPLNVAGYAAPPRALATAPQIRAACQTPKLISVGKDGAAAVQPLD